MNNQDCFLKETEQSVLELAKQVARLSQNNGECWGQFDSAWQLLKITC